MRTVAGMGLTGPANEDGDREQYAAHGGSRGWTLALAGAFLSLMMPLKPHQAIKRTFQRLEEMSRSNFQPRSKLTHDRRD